LAEVLTMMEINQKDGSGDSTINDDFHNQMTAF
jgi:hypothetical protein